MRVETHLGINIREANEQRKNAAVAKQVPVRNVIATLEREVVLVGR